MGNISPYINGGGKKNRPPLRLTGNTQHPISSPPLTATENRSPVYVPSNPQGASTLEASKRVPPLHGARMGNRRKQSFYYTPAVHVRPAENPLPGTPLL